MVSTDGNMVSVTSIFDQGQSSGYTRGDQNVLQLPTLVNKMVKING